MKSKEGLKPLHLVLSINYTYKMFVYRCVQFRHGPESVTDTKQNMALTSQKTFKKLDKIENLIFNVAKKRYWKSRTLMINELVCTLPNKR